MAVIVNNMDIPERCYECRLCEKHYTSDYGSYGNCVLLFNRIVNCLGRDKYCPLKSVDGLKSEINKMPNDNPSYWNTCDVVDREKVLDVIDSYCGGGND